MSRTPDGVDAGNLEHIMNNVKDYFAWWRFIFEGRCAMKSAIMLEKRGSKWSALADLWNDGLGEWCYGARSAAAVRDRDSMAAQSLLASFALGNIHEPPTVMTFGSFR